MKINVPRYILEYDDWHDRELVVFSLFLAIIRETEDVDHTTIFHMCSDDIRRILGGKHLNHNQLGRIRRCATVAIYDDKNMSFQIDQDTWVKGGCQLTMADANIEELHSIKVWCYLAGRLTDSVIVTDFKGILTHELVGPSIEYDTRQMQPVFKSMFRHHPKEMYRYHYATGEPVKPIIHEH